MKQTPTTPPAPDNFPHPLRTFVVVGGNFTAESAPGKGTTIRVEIPFTNGNRVWCL